MKQIRLAVVVIALHVALTAAAQAQQSAQQSAQRVRTTGVAQMNRASDAMIAKNGPDITVRLPEIVSKGEVIAIQYQGDGSSISDSFMVTEIVLKNGSCVLQSKHQLKKANVPIDTIRVESCRKLE